MTVGLRDAIERLYSTFGGYPLRSPAPPAHGSTPDEVRRVERRLRGLPLRAIGLDELHRFYAEGVLTWGGPDDLRHLLPRLMELFAQFHLGEEVAWSGDPRGLRLDLEPNLALLRFSDADWEDWPEPEREAVCDFLFELWRAWLASGAEIRLGPGGWLEEGLPEAILRLVPDPAPHLAHWRAAGWPASRHLAWYVALDHQDQWLAWMDEDHPASVRNWYAVRGWLDEPETAALLLEAAHDSAPRDQAWEALLGLEVLQRGRRAVGFAGGAWVPDARSRRRARALGVALPSGGPR